MDYSLQDIQPLKFPGIDDEGATVIFDAQGSEHIFHINSQNVKIKGITFKNAHSDVVSTGFNSADSGLCLDINDNHFSAEDCIFINNTAPNLRGGAIHVEQYLHDINITNCNFENNTADVGGCIRSEQRSYDIQLKDCNFTNNKATTHGGVACLFGNGTTIDNCTFKDNVAPSSGAE